MYYVRAEGSLNFQRYAEIVNASFSVTLQHVVVVLYIHPYKYRFTAERDAFSSSGATHSWDRYDSRLKIACV